MVRPVPNRAYERQPRHFGAAPYQYRYGTAVGSAKVPPGCEPEMQHDAQYPHYVDECGRDVRGWRAAIEAPEVRHGPLIILAPGGAARRLFDMMGTAERQYGVDVPGGAGGFVDISAVDFIVRVLEAHLPAYEDARVLCTGPSSCSCSS